MKKWLVSSVLVFVLAFSAGVFSVSTVVFAQEGTATNPVETENPTGTGTGTGTGAGAGSGTPATTATTTTDTASTSASTDPVGVSGGAGSGLLDETLTVGNNINPYEACDKKGFIGEFGCDLMMFAIYGIWFRVTFILANAAAYFADFFLWFSLQSQLYRFGDLMTQGWVIVRNFVNIGFIAALLYTGIHFIRGKGNGASILLRIIVSALLVNFSLFGARLIIDAGNITARAIYTQIQVSGVNGTQEISNDVVGETQISSALLNILNPQAILFKDAGADDPDILWKLYTMFILSGIIHVMLIFIFLSMGILFVTRAVSLIVLGILVPIPIVVDLIPQVKANVQKLKSVGSVMSFENWFTEYWKLSAIAPVYCFFLYLIIMVQAGYSNIQHLRPTVAIGSGIIGELFAAMIPTIITFFLIRFASSVTKDLSGTFGAMVTRGLNSVVGAVGGFALGAIAKGTSLAGGAIGKRLQDSAARGMTPEQRAAELAEASRGKNFFQRKLLQARYGADSLAQARIARAGNYLTREATYDARNIRNTGAFRAFANTAVGRAAIGEASRTGIADVNWGQAQTRSYNERDTARVQEAERRRQATTATLHQAMDDHNQRERVRQEAARANHPGDPERLAELESERQQLMDRSTTAVTDKDIRDQKEIVAAGEKKLKDLEKEYKAATNLEDKNRILREIQVHKIQLKKNKKKLEKMEFDKKHQSERTLAELEAETETLENGDSTTGVLSVTAAQEDIETREKEIDKSKRSIEGEKAALALLRKQVEALKKKGSSRTAAENIEFASKERDLQDRDIKLAQKQKDEVIDKQKKIAEDKEALKKRNSDIEKNKKAVEERTKRAEEIEESVSNKSYLEQDDEAEVYSDTIKSLKEQHLKEKDPKKKQDLLSQIHSLGGYIDTVRNDKKKTNPNSSFEVAFQKSMLDQHDLNKQVASHMVATDMIRDMQNAYSNMGRIVGATLAGAAVTAVGTLVAASTPAILGAIVAGTAVGMATDTALSVQNSPGMNNNRQHTIVGRGIDAAQQGMNAAQLRIDQARSWFNRSSSMQDIERSLRESMR